MSSHSFSIQLYVDYDNLYILRHFGTFCFEQMIRKRNLPQGFVHPENKDWVVIYPAYNDPEIYH